jgi:DNA repair exonuclease SbcCD ATPase subunit
MERDRPVTDPSPPEKTQQSQRDLVSLPSLPSFTLADENNIVDIEIQADHLLNYINKLTALADRACSTAIHQSESAQRLEANRQAEIKFLRQQLEHGNEQFREQQQAMARLEQNSREQVAALETELRQKEVYRIQREKEFLRLRSDHDALANRQYHPVDSVRIDDELKFQVANRDEAIQTKNHEIKAKELEFRAKMIELEQRLRDSQAELQLQETKLKEKEALLQATAAKETEIGNLIKRLSSECESLNGELQQKSQVLARFKSKKDPPANDGKIWRRVIGRLQEDM